jgi:predicted amidohydrolase
MRIAGLQLDIAWEDPETNYARIRPWLASARAAGARMVVLPEMFPCGFSMAPDRVAEPEGGRSTAFLLEEAAKHDLYLAGSIPEIPKGASRPSNTLLLAGPDGSLARYRKIHPFTFAGEDRHYAAGDRHVTVSVEGLRLTLFVCYDLRFADEFWTTASATDAYLVVANWPERRRHHWTALLQARAIENQAYVVGVSRVGSDPHYEYAGRTLIIDPQGEILTDAGDGEGSIAATLDLVNLRKYREGLPFLNDMK